MISKLLYIYTLFFLLGIFISCKKDPNINVSDNVVATTVITEPEINYPEPSFYCTIGDSCTNLAFCQGIPVQLVHTYPYIRYQNFNPTNPNEMAYSVVTATSSIIYKHNIQTGVNTQLCTNVHGYLDWRKDGFIYLVRDNEMYKVNANTFQESKLSFYHVESLEWFGFFDDKLPFYITRAGKQNLDLVYYIYHNNQRSDSAYASYSGAAHLSNSGTLAYCDTGNGFNIAILKIINNKKSYERVTNLSDADQITEVKWHPNNKDIFFVKKLTHLYKVNINTKKVTLIKKTCGAQGINDITISPDGKKIIIGYDFPQNDPNYLPPGCMRLISNYLYIMDVNGCNGRVLVKD
jgi:hypothetical protein